MAYLKHDYKIMYEGIENLVKQLKATKTIPESGDSAVVFKLEDGTVIDPSVFKIIFEKDGSFFGTVSDVIEDGIEFFMYCNNELLLGRDTESGTVNLSVETSISNATAKIYGKSGSSASVNKGSRQTLIVYPNEGYSWKVAPTKCLVNDIETAVSSRAVGNVIAIEIIVNEDTVVKFNEGETEAPTTTAVIKANKDTSRTVEFSAEWGFYGEDPSSSEISKTVNIGDTVRVYVEPDFSSIWDTEPTTCKVNGVNKPLTKYGTGGYYYINVTVNEAEVTVIFDTGITRAAPIA